MWWGACAGPWRRWGRVPFGARFRDVVRPLLLAHLARWPQAFDRVGQITSGSAAPDLSGPPLGLEGEPLQELRVKIAASAGQLAPGVGPGLKAAFLCAFASLAGDPDRDLAAWVEAGAPLGVRNHLSPSGIFPALADAAPASEAEIHGMSADPVGWGNYRSAEEDPAACTTLLDHMVQSGWAVRCPSHGHLLRELGVSATPLNRLGLISKARPTGLSSTG